MESVYILSSSRTPLGHFLGGLSSLSAPTLAGFAIRSALEKAQLAPELISEVILGQVLTAGVGQAPARQAAALAKLPTHVPAFSLNKVCGSGMKAVMLAAQAIQAGDAEICVAGGMESMSQAPFLLPQARTGLRLGNQLLVDSAMHDGLWDVSTQSTMGQCAELCAREKHFSREQQDEFAAESFKRAIAAQKSGYFQGEITPIELADKKGQVLRRVEHDEGPQKFDFAKMTTLKPAFLPAGTITAANASSLSDGAAVLILASASATQAWVKRTGLQPLARWVSAASHGCDPQWFTTAPIQAMQKALARAQWEVGELDLVEVNEAFAVVPMIARQVLALPAEKLNVWGGAIALGHPLGASGARILVTLLAALKQRGLRRGLASVCIGGGEATASCVELLAKHP